ncbi:MAG: hypothetical protein M0C28_24530 [Candidatus Moduliflexus flocculans]|nr:hypothetical protein [Candidatus Moduliflexus flocculans]
MVNRPLRQPPPRRRSGARGRVAGACRTRTVAANCSARADDGSRFLHRVSWQLPANRRMSGWHAACSHRCSPGMSTWTPQREHTGGRSERGHSNGGSTSG